MALIPENEYAILLSESDVKSVSDDALKDSQEAAIAKLINSSANTGQTCVLYNHPISDDVIQVLESDGYTVKQRSKYLTSSPEWQYLISWEA